MQKFIWFLEFGILKIIMIIYSVIPYERGVRIGYAIGTLGGTFVPALLKRVKKNYQHIYPAATLDECKELSKDVSGNVAANAIEYMWIKKLFARRNRINIIGEDVLEQVKNAKSGAIFVSAHYANWEAVRAAAFDHVPMSIIYRKFNNDYFDEYSMGLMQVFGEPSFHKGPKGMLAMARYLKKGGSTLILVDQRMGNNPTIPFMGAPADTSISPAELALKFNLPLIPCYARRLENKVDFEVTFEEPIMASDALTMTTEINERISSWIKKEPKQWFWLHNRWKYRM